MKRILYTVAIKIFLSIQNGTFMAEIYKKNKSPFATIFRLVSKFEEVGLIKTEKIGRKRIIYLTKKGESIQDNLRYVR